MVEQPFSIEFDGYWREENKAGIPSQSGIYCVYTCTHNVHEKTVSIHKLVYIGEASDVGERIAKHKRYNDWRQHLRAGEELCFSFGAVAAVSRARCEAAIIFKHKPPENTEYKASFPFDGTTMILSGKAKFLSAHFTVHRTPVM